MGAVMVGHILYDNILLYSIRLFKVKGFIAVGYFKYSKKGLGCLIDTCFFIDITISYHAFGVLYHVFDGIVKPHSIQGRTLLVVED
jgi:hypothetical protein